MEIEKYEITSPDGEKFQVTVEDRKVSVQIPEGRKSAGDWVFDQCHNNDYSVIESKAFEIARSIVNIYEKC